MTSHVRLHAAEAREDVRTGCSHPEDALPDLVSEAGIEQQAVQLLYAPVQQHSLHLLTRGAASQQLVQHIQGPLHLTEGGENRETRERGEERRFEKLRCQNTRVESERVHVRMLTAKRSNEEKMKPFKRTCFSSPTVTM